jgi:4-hydroxybenzoate polyprenyltransferase
MFGAFLASLRPRQWTKNLLVFAGLVFSRSLFDVYNLLRSVALFAAFCLLSGAVYIVNDLRDRENDRNHPEKMKRPIASGRLKPGPAIFGALFITLAGLGVSWYLDWRVGLVGLGYFLMQVAYSFTLKHVVVVDVMTVAAGFALRAVAGTTVVGVMISPWLFICTILLALFVAIAKRRHELISLGDGGVSHRSVLGKYSETLLDQMISVATSAAVITYCLYTISPETVAKFKTHNLILTVPFVLYGVYRYLYLVHRKELGGAPERLLLSDLPLLLSVLFWMASVVVVLYVRF